MREKITERARGHWRGILAALAVSPTLIDGKHHGCPICGQGKDCFRFADYDGTGGYICSRCGNGSGFDLLMAVKGWDFKTAAREVEGIIGSCEPDRRRPERSEEDKRAAMTRLWRSGRAVTVTDPVGRYLAARCGVGEAPQALRYVESLHYAGSDERYPSMIAKLSAPDGSPNNIHRTYLTETGTKAPVDAPRRMMPGTIAKGACVRLSPAADVLGIAEGIETALSAAKLFEVPCWAALNSELLKAWHPPAGVSKVIIFGDNDENFTGQAAAYALAKRLSAESISAEIKIPDAIGEDWNDVLTGKSNVASQAEEAAV